MMEPKRPRGRPRKLGSHRAFTLRLPSELHGELLALARSEGRSLNDLLVQIAQEWLAKRKQDQPYARESAEEDR